MARFPRTLWRSYTWELARLLGISAGVLVTVITFAGAVKPMSAGLLEAGDALKFMLLAVPPMLAYALPFAGGFAATLVYHRLSTDLESVAAYAGGISHRSLLTPALGIGLACSVTLTLLYDQVIPRFLHEMQRMITVDVARVIAQQVSRGQTVTFKDIMIHADSVRSVKPEAGSGVMDQLFLTGFGAVILKNDEPTVEATAARAKVWLLPAEAGEGDAGDSGGRTMLVVQLEDVVGVREGGGVAASADSRFVQVVPNTFNDKVKFLSWSELADVLENPERMNWVEPKRRALALTLAKKQGEERLAAGLRAEGRGLFIDERGHEVVVRAGGVRWEGDKWVLSPPPGGALLASYTRGARGAEAGQRMIATAQAAHLIPETTAEPVEQRVAHRLELVRARVRDEQSPGADAPERAVVAVGGLSIQGDGAGEYLAMGSRELLEAARPWLERSTVDGEVRERVHGTHGLAGALVRLDNSVLAKRHEFMALVASCFVMVICGAVTALKFSSKLPLTVYLFTIFPALASIVTISGGQQATVRQGATGLLLMWSGVAALSVYTLVIFMRLRRH